MSKTNSFLLYILQPRKSEMNLFEESMVHDSDTDSYFTLYKSHQYKRKNWFVGLDTKGHPIQHRFRTRHHHDHRAGELFTISPHPTPVVTTVEDEYSTSHG